MAGRTEISPAYDVGDRISTGVEGIDPVLHGGFVPQRTYMVRGDPGTGKSLLGLHFLTEGVESGETVLYINLEETEENIRQNARSFGFDVEGIEFLDLSPDSEFFSQDLSYDVFSPDEVEQETITAAIAEALGISPSTLHQHLRIGERKLLATLFEGSE
jgi:circadian clock protein KaiC